jgi:SAM-dependent methyltransferase
MNAAAAARQRVSQPEWFASWFDSAHYHSLYAHRDGAEAAALIGRLIDRLRMAGGATVLDLGCGTGRHARALASRGFNVLGIDLSAESIRQAKESEGPNLWFRRQDMRLPFGNDVFDFVVNLFTSYGYFEDPADDLTVIHNIARSLRAGGRVVLDYLNTARAARALARPEVVERDGVAYRISRWTDAGHIYKRIVIDDGRGGPLDFVERVARLSVEDFRFMFELSDMTLEATYGDYHLAPFDVGTSPRLILVARKIDGGSAGSDLPARKVLAYAADGLGGQPQI